VAEPRESLRAADADRQFVADRLKDALDEGRLSLSEYDERLRDAYAARTYGDLDRLLVDLPMHQHAPLVPVARPAPSAPLPPVVLPGGRRPVTMWLLSMWGSWLSTVLVCIVIWAVTDLANGDAPTYFWPVWVAGPWGALLLIGTVSGLATGAPQRYLDRHARRAQRRGELDERRRERYERRAQRRRDVGLR
jgi:hypothetical protein